MDRIRESDFKEEHKRGAMRLLEAGQTIKEVAFLVGCSEDMLRRAMLTHQPYRAMRNRAANGEKAPVARAAAAVQRDAMETGASVKELAERHRYCRSTIRKYLAMDVRL